MDGRRASDCLPGAPVLQGPMTATILTLAETRDFLDREFPQWGARMLFFRLGGTTIEVVSALEAGESSPPADRDELWGLSFRVPDAEAAHARLVDYGMAVSGLRDGRKPGTRVFTVKEPGPPILMLEADAP